MQVRILGAHQGDSRDTRFMSILIDGRIAIDAGGLTAALTRDEQLGIEAVLVTHRHYDHIKDLPALAHTLWEVKDLRIYCSPATREALQAHLFNGVVWPALRKPEGRYRAVLFTDVVAGKPFDLLGYSVLPIDMSHTVPTVGYCVSHEGKSLFYTGDTRSTSNPVWASIRPDVLLIETTMPSADDEAAGGFGHMTALSLERDLRAFHDRQGYYPRTLCVHMNPVHEPRIRREIAELSNLLGAEITVAHEGMAIEI